MTESSVDIVNAFCAKDVQEHTAPVEIPYCVRNKMLHEKEFFYPSYTFHKTDFLAL